VRHAQLIALAAWAFTACVATAQATVDSSAGAGPIPSGHAASAGFAQRAKKPAVLVKLIDINSASLSDLKKLTGVGDVEAGRIIAGRPYLSKAELVTKKVMPTGPYLSIRNRVVAMPPKKQKGKA
jgi:DNA uptake protein ComE-like DNA-binding protein